MIKNKIGHLTPELLKILRRIATIESIGASTRIEGSKLSDREIEKLLLRLKTDSLPRLASDIIQLVQNKGKITINDVIQATNAPRSTIKKYLGMLVDQKYLTRHGQGRAIWYTQT